MDQADLMMMADDYGQNSLTLPEKSMLDRERTDLMDKGDMLKIFRYLLDKQLEVEDLEDKELQKLFKISTSKAVGTTFLRDDDEFAIMSKFDLSNIMYQMQFPRSEKKVSDFVKMNELKVLVLSNIRKSQGFTQNKINLLTLFSTIFKHNIHTMTDQGAPRGLMGGIGRLFGKV